MKYFKDQLLLLNLSERTISTYVQVIKNVSEKVNKPVECVSELDLREFILNSGSKLSTSTQALIINAFTSYYKIVSKRKFDNSILPRPKVYQKQPDVLSSEEMQLVIQSISNLKHKAIVCLMYSCGLRVSEVLNLKIVDLDSTNNKINLRQAKGNIDRVVMLDQNVLTLLRNYWRVYTTKEYLFEGAKGGKYSSRSIQSFLKKAVKNVGIKKNISTHSLRHSCFTQMVKNGVDLRTIQKLAGHKDINTTANYITLADKDILDTSSPISNINIL